jgi:hypothetical protein
MLYTVNKGHLIIGPLDITPKVYLQCILILGAEMCDNVMDKIRRKIELCDKL